MRTKTRLARPLNLELLEDRFCPSVNEQFIGGSLILSGFPNGNLSITRVAGAPLALQVKDGTTKIGTFNVTNDLRLNLAHYSGNITIDFAGATGTDGVLGGNLVLNLGHGNTAAAPGVNVITISGGTVGGMLSVQGGSGNEAVNLGSGDGAPGTAPTLAVGSSANVNVVHGNGLGNTLAVFGGSAVRGNLLANGVDSLGVGDFGGTAARVGGSLFASDYGSTANSLSVLLVGGSTVGSNVSILGTNTNGAGGGGDLFSMSAGTTVGGNVAANLGNGLNTWMLDGTVSGSVNVTGGNGTTTTAGIPVNLVEVSGTLGSLNVNLGNADSTIAGAFGNDFAFTPTGTILGSLNVRMGNGSNTLDGDDLGLAGFRGTVNGSTNINLGNGTNKFSFEGVVSGPTLAYTGGHGANSVTLDTVNPANPNTFDFLVHLGAGATNVVTYTSAATANSALLDFGAPGPNNTFNSTAPITFPNTILNF